MVKIIQQLSALNLTPRQFIWSIVLIGAVASYVSFRPYNDYVINGAKNTVERANKNLAPYAKGKSISQTTNINELSKIELINNK